MSLAGLRDDLRGFGALRTRPTDHDVHHMPIETPVHACVNHDCGHAVSEYRWSQGFRCCYHCEEHGFECERGEVKQTHGFKPARPVEDVERALDLIRGGMTIPEAAKASGIPRSSIDNWVRRAGIIPKPAKPGIGRAITITRGKRVAVCRRGHAMTPENTYTRPNGKAECKECRRAVTRKWYQKRKEVTTCHDNPNS